MKIKAVVAVLGLVTAGVASASPSVEQTCAKDALLASETFTLVEQGDHTGALENILQADVQAKRKVLHMKFKDMMVEEEFESADQTMIIVYEGCMRADGGI